MTPEATGVGDARILTFTIDCYTQTGTSALIPACTMDRF